MLAGPTASGKTAAALAVARRFDVEIVSVDSALVYRGMDIGTAKPDAHELAAVPHHLIDIRDPLQPYSAAEFVCDAQRLIREISARGRIPMLVGGTMLYFKALLEGLDDMPKADPGVRAEIAEEAARKGWPALHSELAAVDAVTAARLEPQDSQRISRALEVFRVSGLPLSSFQLRLSRAETGGASLAGQGLVSLEPGDRAWLHGRIAERFDLMLAAGFIDEVIGLRARGDLDPDLPSMRCVGYRQAWQMLDELAAQGLQVRQGMEVPAAALAVLRDKGIAATRQLAKRQLTWLRSMPARQVVPCDAPGATEMVLRALDELVHKGSPA
ncbi:MAG: tRNA (adenosine(37)-N6)-dimethylallyltransferase MiaA [Pseudomonadota bacterium]